MEVIVAGGTKCWADVVRTTPWAENVTTACDAQTDVDAPLGLCPPHAYEIVPGAPEPPAPEPEDHYGWLPYDSEGGYLSMAAWGGAAA